MVLCAIACQLADNGKATMLMFYKYNIYHIPILVISLHICTL